MPADLSALARGHPPLAGFFGKFYLFASVLDDGARLGLLWLVLLAIAMSVVSFYYYLRVLKQVYVTEPLIEAEPIRSPRGTLAAVWTMAALVVLLGCLPDLLLNRISASFH